jgi:ATP-dependent exoDNAse (exonuclease V), alpha subunit - helicase superfamily I member
VAFSEILLPDNAPTEYSNREVLWNAVEQIEKAKNSQLAREIELALPKELTLSQNLQLVHDYVKQQFVSAGMCADICIHDKGDGNPHAHIMLTMRPFEQDGTWGAKAHKINGKKVCTTDWNEQTKAEQWRAAWSEVVNEELEKQGNSERVDHRSYERQQVEQLPTVHMGVAASQMERRGIRTSRGDRNREIGRLNRLLRNLKVRVEQLRYWLKGIAYRGNTEEKPSVLAKLESYKKVERNTVQKRKDKRSR